VFILYSENGWQAHSHQPLSDATKGFMSRRNLIFLNIKSYVDQILPKRKVKTEPAESEDLEGSGLFFCVHLPQRTRPQPWLKAISNSNPVRLIWCQASAKKPLLRNRLQKRSSLRFKDNGRNCTSQEREKLQTTITALHNTQANFSIEIFRKTAFLIAILTMMLLDKYQKK